MLKATINETQHLVDKLIQYDNDRPLDLSLTTMLWGSFGIGKTAIVNQIGKKNSFEVRTLLMSTLTPPDVNGLPVTEKTNKGVLESIFAKPNFLPHLKYEDKFYQIDKEGDSKEQLKNIFEDIKNEIEDTLLTYTDFLKLFSKKNTNACSFTELVDEKNVDRKYKYIDTKTKFIGYRIYWDGKQEIRISKKPVILFFDEVNTAPPTLQSICYRIALERVVGLYELPYITFEGKEYKCFVVMAGNRSEDRGATYDMALPLANRMSHIELEVSVDEFLQYGIQSGFNEVVLAYVKTTGHIHQLMQTEDKSKLKGIKTLYTPRTWEYVSGWVDKFGFDRTGIESFIGDEAIMFCEYAKLYRILPENLEHLLDGTIKNYKLPSNDEIDKLDINKSKIKGVGNFREGLIYFFLISLTLKLVSKPEKINKERMINYFETLVSVVEDKNELLSFSIGLIHSDNFIKKDVSSSIINTLLELQLDLHKGELENKAVEKSFKVLDFKI